MLVCVIKKGSDAQKLHLRASKKSKIIHTGAARPLVISFDTHLAECQTHTHNTHTSKLSSLVAALRVKKLFLFLNGYRVLLLKEVALLGKVYDHPRAFRQRGDRGEGSAPYQNKSSNSLSRI